MARSHPHQASLAEASSSGVPMRDLLIALNLAPKLSRAALCRLAVAPEVWQHEDPKACAVKVGVPAGQIAKAKEAIRNASRIAADEQENARRQSVQILTRDDAGWPRALTVLSMPPPVLYVRGRLETLDPARAVAIVGARRMDGYGRECTRRFARALAEAGFLIVSGFAMGIDSVAHDSTLEAGGATLAVLGCGLDLDYPRGSRPRAAAIAQTGALVTEFPLGWQPRPFNFPIRNRLIAAFADATLVVQAKARSGSLITAHHALDLGRDVYAIPGRILDELSQGTNHLIADGAFPALRPDDLLERLGVERPESPKPASLSPRSEDPAPAGDPTQKILNLLAGTSDGKPAEDLSQALGIPLDQLLATLLELELEGKIVTDPGPVYVLRR